MATIALIGVGKIGKLAAELLARKYNVTVYELDESRGQDFVKGMWSGAARLTPATRMI